MDNIIIKTSDKLWLRELAKVYHSKKPATIIDDAHVGIDPSNDSLISMGLKAKLTIQEWVAVGVALGLSAAGIWILVAAIGDPEPTSKLGLLIGGGVISLMGGGFSAIYILTKRKPPKITLTQKGFEITWD